ncbi:MAG: precorrin-6A synthase (deacetylating) [Devosia sp.]|nr:precorrin-6A synthase (deacetylating) [Devosia sp.]
MKTVLVIGIGTGNPEHLTVAGIKALNRADLLFIPDKGAAKADLADVRRDIITRYVTRADSRSVSYGVPRRDAANPDYGAGVDDWHAALADIFADLIAQIPERGAGAFLVWGDPSLYDSTLRILERVRARADIAVEVIPGITAIQALTAAHAIALNQIGAPVAITTGRKLGGVETDTVVMLDGRLAFLDADPDLTIYWGAYLGTPDEILMAGRLGDIGQQIVATRQEARQRHGWIMDIYLLRREL